ncbi:MAG: peptide deformylase [Planctomycetota bacterium]
MTNPTEYVILRVCVEKNSSFSVPRAMSLEVIKYPHPTLRYNSKNVMKVDAELRRLASEMLDLMYEKKGVGLAANQVDLPLRMFVANPMGEKGAGEEYVLLNPEVQLPKGSEIGEEGCLSLPGLVGKVARPNSIKISAYDIKGNQIETRIEGFLARVFLHEIDHLDGKMFFDRMDDAGLAEISEGIEDFVDDFRSQQEDGSLPNDDELIARLKNWTDKYC